MSLWKSLQICLSMQSREFVGRELLKRVQKAHHTHNGKSDLNHKYLDTKLTPS